MKLYFHLVRLGEFWCEVCPSRDKQGFKVKPQSPLYRALRVKFQKLMTADTFTVVLRCKSHIPEGSWIEGIDKSTYVPDPEADRHLAYLIRKHRLPI